MRHGHSGFALTANAGCSPQYESHVEERIIHIVSLLPDTRLQLAVIWRCDFPSNLSPEDAADLIECKIRVETYSLVRETIILDVVTGALHRADTGGSERQGAVADASPLIVHGSRGLTDHLEPDRFFQVALDGNESDGTDMEMD